MTEIERKEIIRKKEVQLARYKNFLNHNYVWFFVVIILISLALVIGSIVYSISFPRYALAGVIICIIFSFLLVFYIVCFPIYLKRKKNAPFIVPKLEEELAALKNEQIENSLNVSKNEEIKNIELLDKYKKLLDSGVISQEEFDKKKKELL